jgi:hypothetical protein
MHALTFCTPELSHHAAAWSAACRAAGLIPVVDYVASRGSWQENTNMKPSVILDHESLFPLVFADVDTLIRPGLPLPELSFDVGLLDDPNHPGRLSSSLLWLGKGSRPFLDYWARLCAGHPTRLDRPLMVQAYLRTKQEVVFHDLSDILSGHWEPEGHKNSHPSTP